MPFLNKCLGNKDLGLFPKSEDKQSRGMFAALFAYLSVLPNDDKVSLSLLHPICPLCTPK